MRWEQMIYSEDERLASTDPLNSFAAIHLTGKHAFKIPRQREGKKSTVSLLFLFYLNVKSLGLFWFWFTSEFSETTLLLFVFFFNERFSLSSEDWCRAMGTWGRCPSVFSILSAGFNFILATTGEPYFLIRASSWAVMMVSPAFIHSPKIYWMPARDPVPEKKA